LLTLYNEIRIQKSWARAAGTHSPNRYDNLIHSDARFWGNYKMSHLLLSPWLETQEKLLEVKKVLNSFNNVYQNYKVAFPQSIVNIELDVDITRYLSKHEQVQKVSQLLGKIHGKNFIPIIYNFNENVLIKNLHINNWAAMRNTLGNIQEIFEFIEKYKQIPEINQLNSPLSMELFTFNKVEIPIKRTKIYI
jgi:hypothetical protein